MTKVAGWVLAGSCLLLSACNEEDDEMAIATSLEEVRSLEVYVHVTNYERRATIGVSVGGHSDEDGGRGLIWLRDFAIRVGDHESMPGRDRVDPGGTNEDFPHLPSAEMDLPDGVRVDGASLAVTDGVTTLEIPLHDGLVVRRLAWVEPADGVLHGADRVAIAWSPASDLAAPPWSVSVSHGDQHGDVTVDATDPATGVLRATLPPLVGAGEATVRVLWDKELTRQPCLTGFCSASVDGYVVLPAVVGPESPSP